jgi:hypothetical protein
MKKIEKRIEQLPAPVRAGLETACCVAFIAMLMGMVWLSLFL